MEFKYFTHQQLKSPESVKSRDWRMLLTITSDVSWHNIIIIIILLTQMLHFANLWINHCNSQTWEIIALLYIFLRSNND